MAKLPTTPALIAEHGWRDAAYRGEDACQTCDGWGTRIAGPDDTHRTCFDCKGTGHLPALKT